MIMSGFIDMDMGWDLDGDGWEMVDVMYYMVAVGGLRGGRGHMWDGWGCGWWGLCMGVIVRGCGWDGCVGMWDGDVLVMWIVD